MRSVSTNAIANLFNRVWSGALQFVFTPIYVHLLGPEAYGLVGFYATLLGMMLFLDQAVSPVLVRELARFSAGHQDDPREIRNLLRSLEIVSITTALIAGGCVWFAAPALVDHWINVGHLPHASVVHAVRLMGLVLACQWPTNVYGSGFIGLHRQDLMARIRVVFNTIQWAGAALILWRVAPSVSLLLEWQAATLALLTVSMAIILWRLMPHSSAAPRFDVRTLRSVWRFALGTFAIGLMGSLLTQSDKLLVSKYASLDRFAAYTLAFTLASFISIMVAQPICSALLPHFARLASKGDEKELAREYHRWTQILCALAIPLSGAMMIFGKPIVFLWLGRNSPLAPEVLVLLPWVALGTLLNTIMMIPFTLQLACGWTRLSVAKNVVAVIVFLPALVVGIPRFGPLLGAGYWVAVNLGYYLFEVPLMHRRLLKQEMWTWWTLDTFVPAVAAILMLTAATALLPATSSVRAGVAWAALAGGSVQLALLTLLPYPRAQLNQIARMAFKAVHS